MAKVVITDWSNGLATIDLVLLLKRKYGFGLTEARTAVDGLLGRKNEVSINLDSNADLSDVENDMDQFDITYKIVD